MLEDKIKINEAGQVELRYFDNGGEHIGVLALDTSLKDFIVAWALSIVNPMKARIQELEKRDTEAEKLCRDICLALGNAKAEIVELRETSPVKGLKVFTCSFQGIYPVGAVALIFASNEEQARDLLWKEFSEELKDKNNKRLLRLAEYKNIKPMADILLNGDY